MSLAGRFRRSFVSGVILLTPLAVTLFVLRTVVGWTLSVVDPLVRGTRLAQYTGNIELAAQFIAVAVILLVVFGLGTLAQFEAGRRVFGNFGRVMTVLPLMSTVYTSIRRITTSLVDRETDYDRVVLVEYPREEMYAVGLVTAEGPTEVKTVTGEPVYNVFLPNSPNPTAGRLAMMTGDQIHELDMSARRAMGLLVTMGIDDERVPVSASREVAE